MILCRNGEGGANHIAGWAVTTINRATLLSIGQPLPGFICGIAGGVSGDQIFQSFPGSDDFIHLALAAGDVE